MLHHGDYLIHSDLVFFSHKLVFDQTPQDTASQAFLPNSDNHNTSMLPIASFIHYTSPGLLARIPTGPEAFLFARYSFEAKVLTSCDASVDPEHCCPIAYH